MRGIILALALVACGPPAREPGSGDDDAGSDAFVGGEECPGGTELIYTIDQFNYRLSRFDPATKTFQDLGSLSCPGANGTPFSMSVDRRGAAWVLYTSGQLFRVAIANLSCTATTWVPQSGLRVFGMGFSTDQPGVLF